MRLRGLSSLQTLVVLLWIAGMLLASCQGKKGNADILTPEQMVERLSDLYILEQKTMRLALPNDSSVGAFKRMKAEVFKRSDLTDSVFKKSFQYYVDRPAELEQIYTAVIDTLSLREQRMEVTSNPK